MNMKSLLKSLRSRWSQWRSGPVQHCPEWALLQQQLANASTIVDLGCGTNPHPRACVAVDAYLAPDHRYYGAGQSITPSSFQESNVQFIQADITQLPFADNSFDFAYSHHVFEHLPDPKSACAEMCRIAKAGAIITPSVFAEMAFGRPYHRWLVLARENSIIFIEKTPAEDRPFGQHPHPLKPGKYGIDTETNPFDIILNDGGWYWGLERMPRLSKRLRAYWYSHSSVTEVVYLWKGSIDCVVIHGDGRVE